MKSNRHLPHTLTTLSNATSKEAYPQPLPKGGERKVLPFGEDLEGAFFYFSARALSTSQI